MALFLKKITKKVCQFRKKHYLCIRNRERYAEEAEFSRKPSAEENRFSYAEAPPKNRLFAEKAEIAQLVEHNLAKVGVAGPSPVFRSTY